MNYKLKYLLLSVCIILQTTLFTLSVSASDIQDDAANKLYALGLFKGTANGFELNRQPTRTEGLAMFIRLLGAEEEALSGKYPHPFSDVPSWADGYVGYAYFNGLAHGVSENTFGAQQYMTVEAYTTLILRALGYNDSNGDFTWNTSVEKAKEIGMLSFEEASNLVSKSATRGSMAQLSLVALSQPLKANSSVTLANNLIDNGIFPQSQAAQYGVLKEQRKPYLADTLIRAVMLSDPLSMMTLDKNNNLIYYDEIKNEAVRVSIVGSKITGTETLFNANNLTYTAAENNSAVTYKGLKIYRVFWDNVANRLIISGEFQNTDTSANDGWSDNRLSSKYGGFFTWENGNIRYLCDFPVLEAGSRGGDICEYILCAMNNGDYVVSTSTATSRSGSTHIWNPNLGTSTYLTGYAAKIFEQNGKDLYIAGTVSSDSGIRKYNFAGGDSEDIANNKLFNGAYFQSGIFYLWDYDNVTAFKTNGQSKIMFTMATDVDIMDMTAFPNELTDFSFVVTTDESFIFYDNSAKSIRIIYPNTDAE